MGITTIVATAVETAATKNIMSNYSKIGITVIPSGSTTQYCTPSATAPNSSWVSVFVTLSWLS